MTTGGNRRPIKRKAVNMGKYNLNHDIIFLSSFEYGKTQNIEIKVGRETLMLDVDKNKISVHVEVYAKKSNDRKSYSKYGSDLHCGWVKPDAIIDRNFIENIREIEKAQNLLKKFKNILV